MSDFVICVGDFADVSILYGHSSKKKRYVVWSLTPSSSPSKMELYDIEDYKSQLILNYIENKWTIANSEDNEDRLMLSCIDNKWTITNLEEKEIEMEFVKNPLLDNVNLNDLRLIDVVKLLSNGEWDYRRLSANPNITFQDVLGTSISSRTPGIREANDLENPEIPWDYGWLSDNPNITLPVIRV